jgi:hypothetical protein
MSLENKHEMSPSVNSTSTFKQHPGETLKDAWVKKEKNVEEVKMLSEVKDPLLNLEKCSLHELINILQNFASDPSINANQAGFGSYITNHVLKEKIARYNQEAMIPPKLGDAVTPCLSLKAELLCYVPFPGSVDSTTVQNK